MRKAAGEKMNDYDVRDVKTTTCGLTACDELKDAVF